MSKGMWLRWGGLWLLFALLVWACVVAWWSLRDIQPTTRDLVLYLGVLPVGGFAVLVLLGRGMRSAAGKAQATQPAPAGDAGPAAAQTGSAAPQPRPPLAILAGAVSLPAGASPEAVEACCVESAQPALHKTLKDRDGFPVLAAWIDDLALADVEQWLDAQGAGPDGRNRLRPEQLRALAALQPVVQTLADHILAEGLLLGPEVEAAAPRYGRTPVAPPLPALSVRLWAPVDWTPAACTVAADWLSAELAACGLPMAQVEVLVEAHGEVAPLLGYLDALAALPADAPAPGYHLALACESLLAPAGIERLQRQGGLLSARQPEGVVPAEGAAGVLAHVPGSSAAARPQAESFLQSRAIEQEGVSWRTGAAVGAFSALVNQALQRNGIEGAGVTALLSDAGLRKSRAALVAGLAGGSFPHLDFEADCLNIGIRNGALGHAGVLAMLAIASARSRRDDSPVVVLHVSAAQARAVFALSPTDRPAAAAAASDGAPAPAA